MATPTFTEAKTVELDGSGNGEIKFSPVPFGQVWGYIRIRVEISTGDDSSGGYVNLYSGEALDKNLLDASVTPWGDTATFNPDAGAVVAPEQLTLKWFSCDSGAVAKATATYVRL
ncbi:MAG: hypothetical protein GY771_05355 [bacterium]|nr:hypothetical protein [bacterium]